MRADVRDGTRKALLKASRALREARVALGMVAPGPETHDLERSIFVAQLAVRDADAALSFTDVEIPRPKDPR